MNTLDWQELFAATNCYREAMALISDLKFISMERENVTTVLLLDGIERRLKTIGIITNINGQKRIEK